MPHGVPERLQLVGEFEQQLVLEFLDVYDPSTGAKLISFQCLKTICIQLEHALAGKLNGMALMF